MANRRMFSKTVVSSSKFLRMPMSSRLLYYDLGMAGDDDGYCEWYPVTISTGAKEQDLQVLQANGFVKIFDQNVLVLLDWSENNYIQKDRYTASKYLNVYKMDTQVRLELGKDTNTGSIRIEQESVKPPKEKKDTQYLEVFSLWGRYPVNWRANTTQISAAKNLLQEHGIEDVKEALKYYLKHRKEEWVPEILTPSDLDRKWLKLEAYYDKQHGKV